VKIKRNGWSWPPHPQQVISLAIFIAMLPLNIYFYKDSTILLTTSILLWIICFVFGYKTTAADVSKPGRLGFFKDYANLQVENDNELAFCLICNQNVSLRTLHCKYCNKCVAVFDHHCFYLSNCIGKYNYYFYFGLLVSLFIYLGFQVVFATNWYYFGVIGVFLVWVGYLLGLHIYLYLKKQTTVEYSREKRQRNAQQSPTLS
jgi:magnesium-transporting ATPase (P-type)